MIEQLLIWIFVGIFACLGAIVVATVFSVAWDVIRIDR